MELLNLFYDELWKIMELLNLFYDELWKSVFSFFYPFTDCTPFVIFLTTGALAIIFCIIRYKIFHSNCVLGILEIPFLYSVYYMIEQLPRLHSRIHLALVTTADVIMQSPEYSKCFLDASNLNSLSYESISRYLYFLNDFEKFSDVAPEPLYYHFFKTLKHTRGVYGFLQVQNRSIFLLFLILSLLVCMLIKDIQKKKYAHCIILIILGWFLLKLNNGVLLSIFIFILIESVCYEISYWIEKT